MIVRAHPGGCPQWSERGARSPLTPTYQRRLPHRGCREKTGQVCASCLCLWTRSVSWLCRGPAAQPEGFPYGMRLWAALVLWGGGHSLFIVHWLLEGDVECVGHAGHVLALLVRNCLVSRGGTGRGSCAHGSGGAPSRGRFGCVASSHGPIVRRGGEGSGARSMTLPFIKIVRMNQV